jgi:hypothetical protein
MLGCASRPRGPRVAYREHSRFRTKLPLNRAQPRQQLCLPATQTHQHEHGPYDRDQWRHIHEQCNQYHQHLSESKIECHDTLTVWAPTSGAWSFWRTAMWARVPQAGRQRDRIATPRLYIARLGLAGRQRRFDELSLPLVAAAGAAGGLLLSLVPAAMVAVRLASTEGGSLGIWPLTALIMAPFTLLSALSAAVSLLIARRAAHQTVSTNPADATARRQRTAIAP